MSQIEEYQQIRTTGLFEGLDDSALLAVYRAGRTERRGAGEFFFFQGDPADLVFVLMEGRIKLLQLTADGQQVILRMAVPYMLFGLVGSVKNMTYPVTAEAVEPCRAIAWTQPVLDELIARYPRIAMNAMQLMASHVQEFQDRFREMATERVERRLARALLRLTRQLGKKTDEGIELIMSVSRQEMAEMSGTTLFTASRILSEWERQGFIRAGRERVVILQPHSLVKIAEDLPG